jgi:hypothetical protein
MHHATGRNRLFQSDGRSRSGAVSIGRTAIMLPLVTKCTVFEKAFDEWLVFS